MCATYKLLIIIKLQYCIYTCSGFDRFHTCITDSVALCQPPTLKETIDQIFVEVRNGINL